MLAVLSVLDLFLTQLCVCMVQCKMLNKQVLSLVRLIPHLSTGRKEGMKEGNVLFNDTLNTFF